MKEIREFLAKNGYNLAQFQEEFKTHSSYNSFTKMLNEGNAATRLAIALIDIIEGVKIYSLDVVKIDANILSQFREHCKKTAEILRGQYPDLRPHELPDVQLRVLKNGKAQLFFEVRAVLYKSDLLPHDWCFIDEIGDNQ
jgi:hypothetical protein